jgi:hypothetical protein
MSMGKHAAERGEVSCSNELEIFEQQVRLAARDAVRKRLGSAQSGVAQGEKSIGFGRECILLVGGIRLEKAPLAGDHDGVTAMDAAARRRGCFLDPKLLPQRRA